MTEQEWLSSPSLGRMLDFLRDRGTGRRWRLFGCACCRRVWSVLDEESVRHAVEQAERYADGTIPASEVSAAQSAAANRTHFFITTPERALKRAAAQAAAGIARPTAKRGAIRNEAVGVAYVTLGVEAHGGSPTAEQLSSRPRLLRDLFWDPFRPAPHHPASLTSTTVQLARDAYDERELPSGHLDSARLLVLADALEEAGCDNADLLGHLRGPGPHVRGCWAVDLILGKE